jgi:hypothetical protein
MPGVRLLAIEILPAPFRDADGYDGNYRQPFIAYDGDVAQIAFALTRLALDSALQREPSDFHMLLI